MENELSKALAKRVSDRPRPTGADEYGIEQAAIELGALPLLYTWGGLYAIDRNVRVWRIFWRDNDNIPRSPEVVTDVRSWVWAVSEGSRRYPEIQQLLPSRPAEAPDCSECQGVGISRDCQLLRAQPLATLPEFMRKLADGDPWLCPHCGGLGWVYNGPVG